MPTIGLGANFRSFADVAHTLALEREADVQAQLQRDRMNADVEQSRMAAAERHQQNAFSQEKLVQDQTLAQFKMEVDANLRQMEEERLRKGQEDQYNANNFKRAVETGVMMDESGQKYVPITADEQPELYKARQDWLAEKNKADERLREQAKQQAAEHVSSQQLNYLKAGFKLEQTADEAGNPRIAARPLNAQDAEWGWWQEQQKMAEDKILTPEDRIKIEQAKIDAQNASQGRRTAMLTEARSELKDIQGEILRRTEDLDKMEQKFQENVFNASAANGHANALEAALKDAGLTVNPGTDLLDVSISSLSASKQNKIDSLQRSVAADRKAQKDYVNQQSKLESRRNEIKSLESEAKQARARLKAIQSAGQGGGASPGSREPLMTSDAFTQATGVDMNSPGVARLYDIMFVQMAPDSPEAQAAWYQMSPGDRQRMASAGIGQLARKMLAAQAGG